MNETKISDGTKFKIKGARFAAVSANIKYVNRLDLMVIYLETGSIITGVFTSSKTKAPSVLWSKKVTKKAFKDDKNPLAILVNSGNANACTGVRVMKTVIKYFFYYLRNFSAIKKIF